MHTDYQSMSEMQNFAESFNVSNAGKWKVTARLTGLCMLMRRDVFNRIGYFDEGFVIGNCEDDDYGLRVRISRLDLVIAGDSFIHHYGSTSMKTLETSTFNDVYARNQAYYGAKWGSQETLLVEALSHWEGPPLKMVDFYPTHLVVQGPGSTAYWLENGLRHPIDSVAGIQSIRLAQIDLRHFPLGVKLSVADVLQKLERLSLGRSADGQLIDGVIVKAGEGRQYQYKQGYLHRLVTDAALSGWGLNARIILLISDDEKSSCPEGMPIIAPPLIKSSNL